MMDLDDDEAPSLINVADEAVESCSLSTPTVQLQELSLSKVPLTIVTGKLDVVNVIVTCKQKLTKI